MKDLYYKLKQDVTIINLEDGNILFYSDYLSTKLEGKSAIYFTKYVLPKLNGEKNLDEIYNEAEGISKEILQTTFESLVESGILVKSQMKIIEKENHFFPKSFINLLHNFGIEELEVSKKLSNTKIGLIGLNAIGINILQSLIQYGIGNITLLDPNNVDDEIRNHFHNLKIKPGQGRRDKLVSQSLKSNLWNTNLVTGEYQFVKEDIYNLVKSSHLIVACVDKGYKAVNYWINEASQYQSIPVIYSEITGHKSVIGPMIIPNQTPCFMCYQMRSMACSENFSEKMTVEKYFNDLKKEDLRRANLFLSLPSYISSIISTEILKHVLNIKNETLAGKVMEFDAFNLKQSLLPILHKPDCPVCSKKKPKKYFSFEQLVKNHHVQGNLFKQKDLLCNSKTGLIRTLDRYQKDISEPILPYIFRAEVSNHTFQIDDDEKFEICSGKGLSIELAQISALGEGIERYSSSCKSHHEIHYSSYSELNSDKIDPKSLVLYNQIQYKNIDYAPYRKTNEIGWVKGYSLVRNIPTYIPAHAIFMNYAAKHLHEYIFQATSNGLAAGDSLLSAILSGTLEIFERDAFIITWYNELGIKKIDPTTHPDKNITYYYLTYKKRGVDLNLYILPTDAPCYICMAIGFQRNGDGPAACVGLGAGFSLAKAASSAMMEVGQVRPALKKRIRLSETIKRLDELLKEPNKVKDLSDHDLLYSSLKSLHAFNFLEQNEIIDVDWNSEAIKPIEQLEAVLAFCRDNNYDLIYYDLTPSELEKIGLYTVRVIITEFQPIHFGTDNIRLGGMRLFNLPCKLGFQKLPSNISSLNKNPHPLA